MAAVTICSDFEAPKNKVWHCFPIYFPWSDGTKLAVFYPTLLLLSSQYFPMDSTQIFCSFRNVTLPIFLLIANVKDLLKSCCLFEDVTRYSFARFRLYLLLLVSWGTWVLFDSGPCGSSEEDCLSHLCELETRGSGAGNTGSQKKYLCCYCWIYYVKFLKKGKKVAWISTFRNKEFRSHPLKLF